MSTTRRRQNSSVSSSSRTLPLHTRQKSRAYLEPKSAHVSDPFLQKFLGPTFSPADYLNATLPSLETSSRTSNNNNNNINNNNNNNNDASSSSVSLADLSAQTKAQLSQLNAHTTRLTTTLTQLADDILRSGSRLAYEVELLRGETLSLSEALTDALHDDVARFVPGGLQEQAAGTGTNNTSQSTSATQTEQQRRRASTAATHPPSPQQQPQPQATTTMTTTPDTTAKTPTDDPAFITQLQTLTLVRSRLDAVVKTFGDAMEFVFPPSEVSVSSSFLSVSAPEPGSAERSTEEKGQKVLRAFREEIAGLLEASGSGSDDPVGAIERAARRVEELKDLAVVWDGTAEEKGRTKFVDGLAKMVEDRHRDLLREVEQAGRHDGDSSGYRRSANASLDAAVGESRGLSGYGIMSQLQRLRTGL
ncbi:hypothetical protein F5B17DRAFT_407068 [Nemania serpens]|nr:hypothetical protein F5B17DRAFT_407068 [Nemania serpens]